MKWIYLSPHLDDAVFSCGGLIWEQVRRGDPVEVWTICAGDPPAGELSSFAQSLHARWEAGEAPIATRRAEDVRACTYLGAGFRHFSLPDCIYRRHPDTGLPLYTSEDAIFGEVDEAESGLIEWLANELQAWLSPEARVVCPLSLGGHVDHRLVRRAVEGLARALWFYVDFPYALEAAHDLARVIPQGYTFCSAPLSEEGLQAWRAAIGRYASQISTFWEHEAEIEQQLRQHVESYGGTPVLKPSIS